MIQSANSKDVNGLQFTIAAILLFIGRGVEDYFVMNMQEVLRTLKMENS